MNDAEWQTLLMTYTPDELWAQHVPWVYNIARSAFSAKTTDKHLREILSASSLRKPPTFNEAIIAACRVARPTFEAHVEAGGVTPVDMVFWCREYLTYLDRFGKHRSTIVNAVVTTRDVLTHEFDDQSTRRAFEALAQLYPTKTERLAYYHLTVRALTSATQ